MPDYEHVVILVTTDSQESAQKMAKALLKERKAACVNIVPRVDSLFWWEGSPDTAEELLLVIKTRAALVDDVVGLVKANHPYDVPEVIALPIVGGNPDYLEWIDGETTLDRACYESIPEVDKTPAGE